MKEAKVMIRACELCHKEALLHCASDAAFLCYDCDARVHEANFLVARHLRQTLCSHCKCLTGKFISGERSPSLSRQGRPICPSCSFAEEEEEEESDCISSTESLSAAAVNETSRSNNHMIRKKRKRAADACCSSSVSDVSGEFPVKPPRRESKVVDYSKAEGIFVIWCRRLGLNGDSHSVASLACQATEELLSLETPMVSLLPFRVCLAASFWAGLRSFSDRRVATWQNLRRLEAISGVPAKLITAVEMRLELVMTATARRRRRRRSRQDLAEGWAECNR